jgi:formiminotetrahydrofolate cyclodeaminase
MHDQTTTLQQFLDAAASKTPAPGGGSVTALAGALAASMGEMVVNYSVGKKSLQPFAAELKTALAQFHSARQILVQLMAEDQSAYEALTAARKLPDSPESAQQRAAALMICINVPQEMAATAVTILELSDQLVQKVNHFLLSDLAVCADLAMTTVRCAIYNVKANLSEISDANKKWEIEAVNGKLLSRAIMLIQHASPQIWERAAKGS